MSMRRWTGGRRRATLIAVVTAVTIAGLIGASASIAGAQPRVVHRRLTLRATGLRPLSSALAAGGRLRHVSGSFDTQGYRMVLGRHGAPRFVRADAVRSQVTGDQNWLPGFSAVGAFINDDTPITAVAEDSSGDIFIGGCFSSFSNEVTANSVAEWNGSQWLALGSGTSSTTGCGQVNALATSGSQVFVGGSFTSAGGLPNDAAFAIYNTATQAWSAPVGGAVSNSSALAVNAFAISANGATLYVGGSFGNAGSLAGVNSIAAYTIATGAWSGLGPTGHQGLLEIGGCSGATPCLGGVSSMAMVGSELYVGGVFNQAGTAGAADLAEWTGTTWAAGGQLTIGGTYPNIDEVRAHGNNLYVGGEFTTAGAGAVTVNGIVEFQNANVATGNTITPTAFGSGSNIGVAAQCVGCFPGTVNAIAFAPNGNLMIGGTFPSAGGAASTTNLAQWTGSGVTAVASAVGSGLGGTPSEALTTTAVGTIPAGALFVGSFNGAGPYALNNVGLWNGTTWTSFGNGVSSGPNPGSIPGTVYALATSGSDVYAGGQFGAAGSVIAANVAHYNGTSWDDMGGGVNGIVYAVAVDGSDVYVGGSFSQAGGVAASNIAMWDGSSWHPVGSGVDGQVHALMILDGQLWVGGSFAHAGTGLASDVAIWNPDTSTWSPVGGDLSYTDSIGDRSTVYALAALAPPNDNIVVIGGDFGQVTSGSSTITNVNGLLTFDTGAAIGSPASGYYLMAGGVTEECGSSSCPGTVNALLADGDTVMVGGDFDDAGPLASRGLAGYDFDGGSAPWFSDGAVGGDATAATGGSGPTVNALAEVGGNYYVGGLFNTAGSVTSPGVVELDPVSGQFTAMGSGLGTAAYGGLASQSLAEGTDGLFVGGNFGSAGGVPELSMALWNATTGEPTGSQAPVASTKPAISPATTVQGQALTEAHGSWTPTPTAYRYQWQDCDSSGLSCQAISGATQQTYTLAGTDVGHTIRVQEFATASGGTGGPDTSAQTAVVTASSGGTTGPGGSGGTGPGGTGPGGSTGHTGTSGSAGAATAGHPTVSGTTATVPLSCAGTSTCTLNVSLTVVETFKKHKLVAVAARALGPAKKGAQAVVKKTVTVGSATESVAGGQSKKLVLTLNKAGAKLLASHHRLAVKLLVTAGGQTLLSQTLTFTRPTVTLKKKPKP